MSENLLTLYVQCHSPLQHYLTVHKMGVEYNINTISELFFNTINCLVQPYLLLHPTDIPAYHSNSIYIYVGAKYKIFYSTLSFYACYNCISHHLSSQLLPSPWTSCPKQTAQLHLLSPVKTSSQSPD